MGASPVEIETAEGRLGFRFPADYRQFLETTNGSGEWYGDLYLSLYSLDQVVDLTEIRNHAETLPGLVFIGSDGGGEGVGFDFRRDPPAIVLMNLVSTRWEEASFQAESFNEFIKQLERGEAFRWESGTPSSGCLGTAWKLGSSFDNRPCGPWRVGARARSAPS